MIDLSSEPSLGSMVLSRDGVLKYSYVLPRGMTFPEDTDGYISFTDRAGGVYDYSPHYGELSEDLTSITWNVSSDILNHIPAGANFEVFVNLSGDQHKVRYGRVVRKEVDYPLSPLAVNDPPPLMYEDDMQRSAPGPRWIVKAGRPSMRTITGVTGVQWAMSVRNKTDIFGNSLAFQENAAVMWYAPLQSDSIEMSVGLKDSNAGTTTVVLASNAAMTRFIGVRFRDAAGYGVSDTIQVVTGTAWNSVTTVGSVYPSGGSYAFPTSGGIYKITYSYSPTSPQVSVYLPGATTPALQTTITSPVAYGAGYRYTGMIFQASLLYDGPVLYRWKIKDAVS